MRQRLAGCVQRRDQRVMIRGHLSAALSVDLHSAVSAGACGISLADTVSLDSSGLNVLLDMVRSGVPILDAAPEIREHLQRFRLLESAAPTAGEDA